MSRSKHCRTAAKDPGSQPVSSPMQFLESTSLSQNLTTDQQGRIPHVCCTLSAIVAAKETRVFVRVLPTKQLETV